ncbi:hypothetical protein WKI71_25165 [Streptomyces sp. MS1.AVA.1]|uniref:Uncharacterized protein n=1 Tax=Streptomyces machairae TaxID=3134109 RepID=A0ABU8UNN6_9ACTN
MYVLFRQCLAAGEEGGRGGVAAQGAQGCEVLGGRGVPGGERLLQEGEVAGCGAGEGGAVAGEVGRQEGAQPGALAHCLV